ncbi:YKL151C [Zygosaccharomyces parabailii]|uniref:ATP-dependent (S)-NAD(P)H-hydrate dehydratase n=1 Tax=Zygosaccharomyces bailii (strain CLIB 213 / ATCC 58445 / CBS 680 / BCRC 21525 / NBRC 1098 / NCYC 1416 / NRRL Y-2227) TaxID=1333698 RepID=A0A8J2TB53_ZYGB2|nr:YKL151C [Zygosaccharomyces parabailii]CDF90865.1 ZYBA0S08-04984g1_1 [Zygosaccharomyces bailii CLIB 213]CDH16882.1 related to ATP-dependent (S)-NAD(P)H-hydrate dehydratase [Zygosaccharomyces bailii ISA1307]
MSSSSSFLGRLNHNELLHLAKKKCVSPLLPQLHKGQNGRVCIIGGCEDYTGAPFFSARATALMGCDMTHVICDQSAAQVIKSYSPDLMVHPYLHEGGHGEMGKIQSLVNRMHVLVVGPGLGRDDLMLASVKEIIRFVLEEHRGSIPIVLDADALWLVTQDKQVREMLRKFPKGRIVLTPNVVEFKRLAESLDLGEERGELGARIADALSCVLVEKGQQDKVFGNGDCLVNESEGSLKRVGGQGDTLTGTIACLLAFSRARHDFRVCGEEKEPLEWIQHAMLSCYAGSAVTRECAKLAFADKGRAMQTSDVNTRVGDAYQKLLG